jgi:hypothetical protein
LENVYARDNAQLARQVELLTQQFAAFKAERNRGEEEESDQEINPFARGERR